MCHLYPYNNVKLLRKFFYINLSQYSTVVLIGVNFYKAARLEPPTFQTPRLSGFWAPQFFVTCNAYYEAVFYGLPNSKMTPNDIHANHCCIAIVTRLWTLQKSVTLSLLKTKWDERHFPLFRKPLKAVDIMSLSTHDHSGLSHDIVQPGTIDNSVLSLYHFSLVLQRDT